MLGNKRQAITDIGIAVICCHAFETADGNRFFVGASAPAGRFARPVADTAKYAGKDIAFAVQYISIGKSTLGNFADVFGHICMCRTGPLAVHDLVKIIRVTYVGGLHS